MKKSIKSLFTVLFAAVICSGAFAYDAENLVNSEILAALKKDGIVQKSYYKQGNVKLQLVPDTSYAEKATQRWTDSEEPAFVIENLYMLPKSKIGTGNPQKTTIQYASKVIRSISRMEGMQYYSSTHKKYMTLYKNAYSIKGPEDRTKVADDTAGSADGKVLYSMLDDASFGKTNYRLEYNQTETEVAAFFSNTTPMYVGPVKAIENDNLKISMVIIDCGDNMMVYMLIQAKFPALSMLENMMYDSFSSRLDAIYKWFLLQF